MNFKIDLRDTYEPFGLYVKRRVWLLNRWVLIDGFKTRDEAKAFHDKIKDLPEYL